MVIRFYCVILYKKKPKILFFMTISIEYFSVEVKNIACGLVDFDHIS